MTCGTKSNFTANGLQTLNGARQVGVSLSKSCPKHFQAAKKPKGRGGEGGKENALLPVAGISTFKLYRRVGKCMYHFKGKRKFSCTVTFISLKTDLLANGGLAHLASFFFWEAVSLLASFCGRRGGIFFSSLCTQYSCWEAVWVGWEPEAAPRGPQPLARNKDGSHVNPNSLIETSSYFTQALNDRRCSHVARRREEDGNPAQEAGRHDQGSQVCHKPGKFTGKSSGIHLIFY